jgi:hypothetical protein
VNPKDEIEMAAVIARTAMHSATIPFLEFGAIANLVFGKTGARA